MRDFAETFYKGAIWQACRASYLKSKRGLCERCLASGFYTPAVIVHHIIHITPQNIDDPNITLNWDNLQALCRDCHGKVHRPERRYKVDELGRIIYIDQ